MKYNRIISALLLSSILWSSNTTVLAVENETITVEEVQKLQSDLSDDISDTIEETLCGLDSTDEQIQELYAKVGEELGINPKYVAILHQIAGGKAVYADKRPNIYTDLTVDTIENAFYIEGAQSSNLKFKKIVCADQSVERPSMYYLPDAAYSVTYDIVQIMNERYKADRGGLQIYFDALKQDTKEEILFTEAVMQYIGTSEDIISNYYKAYEKMLYDKEKQENIVEVDENGKIVIKDTYKDILITNGITDEDLMDTLAIIFSFDENMAVSNSIEAVQSKYVVPYKENYTSRENMMIVEMCLNGKVRYVWGGGHSGASNINGINPVWFEFNNLYDSQPTDENGVESPSFGKCIKRSGSWCPVHGASGKDCSFTGPMIYDIDTYIEQMSNYIDTTELSTDKYKQLMSTLDFSNGISLDTLNGLDCSGYASWIYNQITSKYEINYVAKDFTNNKGIQKVTFGSELLPGDTFAWSSHIVTIIGKVSDGSKAYVTTEATTNVLKFGVVYYSGASQSDIAMAKQIAREANELIGGLSYEYEEPHVYCMNTAGIYNEYTDSEGNILTKAEVNELVDSGEDISDIQVNQANYCEIGRLADDFIDEDLIISGYNKKIKDMTAQEIIQYTMRKLPYSYVAGYNDYNGELFDKNQVAMDL